MGCRADARAVCGAVGVAVDAMRTDASTAQSTRRPHRAPRELNDLVPRWRFRARRGDTNPPAYGFRVHGTSANSNIESASMSIHDPLVKVEGSFF